jgi:acyl-CoA dehydrogenase
MRNKVDIVAPEVESRGDGKGSLTRDAPDGVTSMEDLLRWPFFDEVHRDACRAFQEGLASKLGDLEAGGEDAADVFALSRTAIRLLGETGWLRHLIPESSTSSASRPDARLVCLIRQMTARRSAVVDAAFAVQGLGSTPITIFGHEEMRRRYLPDLASGQAVVAFALSEPGAGSDLTGLATTAAREGSEFVINGEKAWISNASIADHYIVFARTGDAPGVKGLSAFLVEATAPGFEVAELVSVLAPHPIGTLRFRNCHVPETAVIGELGQGFKIAMSALDIFRPSVGAAAIGLAQRALSSALNYSVSREIEGRRLADLQISQSSIAEMATNLDAAALLVYRAAWIRDTTEGRVSTEPAMAKLFATEASQKVIDQALQLHGSRALVSDHPIERAYREIRAMRIYEGASEVQKLIIARQILKQVSDGNPH